jgi:hypothetical protein
MRVRMMVIERVLAVVPVSDIERADAWYEALRAWWSGR